MTSNFLIQYLRKSSLNSNYLAGYLNSVLRNLIVNTNEYCLLIRGACWARTLNTSVDLIGSIFKNIDLSNTEIFLENHYKGYKQDFVHDAFQQLFPKTHCHIIHSYNPNFKSSSSAKHKDFDHSKEIILFNKSKSPFDYRCLFYMVGSSNFSKQTYMCFDRGVNQTDIAFIPYLEGAFYKSNRSLLSTIIKNDNDNSLLTDWARDLDLGFDEAGTNNSSQGFELNGILTVPYKGNGFSLDNVVENLLDDILHKELSARDYKMYKTLPLI